MKTRFQDRIDPQALWKSTSQFMVSGAGAKTWKLILLLSLFFSGFGCSSSHKNSNALALLSLLSSSRITLIFKGTYATDNPLSYSELNNNNLFVDPEETGNVELTGLPSYEGLPVYIDMGEIRLSSRGFLSNLTDIQSTTDSQKFWDTVSTERLVFCNALYTLDLSFNTCLDQGGIVTFNSLMNGDGVEIPSHDVAAGTYLHAGIFFREIVTGFSLSEGEVMTEKFDNATVVGSNVLKRINYDPGTSSTTKQIIPPQLYPLHHKVEYGQQTSMMIDDTGLPVVLEVRANFKENMMVHQYTSPSTNKSQTAVAFSDWRRPHNAEADFGGNVLARARIFNPINISDLRISGGTGDSRYYYAVYIQNECVDYNNNTYCNKNIDHLPLAATPVRNGENTIKHLSPNNYVLQCLYDEVYDGYPEKVLGEKNFEIGPNPGIVDIACACGYSTTEGCL